MRRLALLLLLPLSACQSANMIQQHYVFQAFGGTVEVTLIDDSEERLQQAKAIIAEDLEYMHTRWHAWNGNNPVSRVNGNLRMQAEFSGPPSLLPLIDLSKQMYTQSNGLFNPALGELFALWHFQGEGQEELTPPDEAAIQAILKSPPTMDHIQLQGIRLKGSHPGIKLDFGGIAKGFGLGQIRLHLQQLGLHHAMLKAGDDICVLGDQQGQAWPVAIPHPRHDGELLARLELKDQEALAMASDQQRYFIYRGERYHHILDPRTGKPARGTQLVVIIHPDPAIADAAATTLFIAGPQQWLDVASRMELEYVLLVDAQGNRFMSPAMQQRLQATATDMQTPQH